MIETVMNFKINDVQGKTWALIQIEDVSENHFDKLISQWKEASQAKMEKDGNPGDPEDFIAWLKHLSYEARLIIIDSEFIL